MKVKVVRLLDGRCSNVWDVCNDAEAHILKRLNSAVNNLNCMPQLK